jgi:prepilin-type N-terminal cleavage/methylation domain-containing protein
MAMIDSLNLEICPQSHGMHMRNQTSLRHREIIGFTLIEVLISMTIAGLVIGTIINIFINHQNSYKAQLQVAGLQQNIRSAMNLISEDIRRSGHYTYLDRRIHSGYVDWNPEVSGYDNFRYSIYGVNNITGQERYSDDTDSILIIKSGDDRGRLQSGENAQKGSNLLNLHDFDIDNDGDDDFNASGKRFGILVKSDLSGAHIFKINSAASESGAPVFHVAENFTEHYRAGDFIARVDIVIYRVDTVNMSFSGPVLERKNAGQGNTFQVVAEDITNLQFKYLLKDGRLVEDPAGTEKMISGVYIKLEGEVNVPGMGIKKRYIENMIRIRNTIL